MFIPNEDFHDVAASLGFLAAEIPEPCAESVEAVIRYLVGRLVTANLLDTTHTDRAVSRLLKREQLGSTGIGRGIAIPHSSFDQLRRTAGVLAFSRLGVHWASVDGKPVHLVCLHSAPSDRPGDYLRIVELAARAMRSPLVRPISFAPAWLTPTVRDVLAGIAAAQAFDRLPILGDALEEAGCMDADILGHCRQPGEHTRRCWVVELLTSS